MTVLSGSIPIIDFSLASTDEQGISKELLKACTDWGFFFVENHSIPQSQIDGIFKLSEDFFAQPDDVKLQAPYNPAKNAGFKPVRYSTDTSKTTDDNTYQTAKDPREAFSMNKWPTPSDADSAPLSPVLDSSRPEIHQFQQCCHTFATSLLRLLAMSLALPPTTFTTFHPYSKPNFDNFEIMHYPPIASSPSQPRHRISPHTDWGTLTLLFQHSGVSGLQVRPPHYTSPTLSLSEETWFSAPAPSDMLLVNIGDMLEFLTAGRLKSTWHRVSSEDSRMAEKDRYCIAYFLHPDRETILEPIEGLSRGGERKDWTPRYAGRGRTAEEHIMERIKGSGLGTGIQTKLKGEEEIGKGGMSQRVEMVSAAG